MNGRERYFNTVDLKLRNGHMAQWLKVALFSPEEVGMRAGSNPGVASSSSFIVFLPLGFLLFILTADPVSFARFLRKRISSINIKRSPLVLHEEPNAQEIPRHRYLTLINHTG